MAVSETSSTPQLVPAIATDPLLSRAQSSSAAPIAPVPSSAPASRETADSADKPKPQPQVSTQGIGFTLRYSQDTHRLILEARDPASGFVIYEQPPQYVLKQFQASLDATGSSPRGGNLDNAV